MKKRILTIAIAAVAALGTGAPAAQAVASEAECRNICLLCDPTQTNCEGCFEFYIAYDRYEFC